MTLSADMLALIVSAALIITIIAPVLLIALFIRDRNKGELW